MKKFKKWCDFFRICFLTAVLTHWLYFRKANKEIKENIDVFYGMYRQYKDSK